MMFTKALVFTDLHFGKRNNDRQHNQDCTNFVKWAIEQGQDFGADAAIFMGDWHDNRYSLHVNTLNYSLQAMEKIAESFPKFYFIPGNHDLYYKEKREISSVSIARNITNVTIINDFLEDDGAVLCPWLVGDDWKRIPELAKRNHYMFGHFELPFFMMNAKVESPDHGQISHHHFSDLTGQAFSGHFHKRQTKDKMTYIGNCFPLDFSDDWDDDRGIMLLDWTNPPKFIAWPDAPKYRTIKLSELLENPGKFLDESVTARVSADLDITFEESLYVKQTLAAQFGSRKVDVLPFRNEVEAGEETTIVGGKTIEQIVIQGIRTLDLAKFDKEMLIDIFKSAE